jgi:hypothetical protein
MASFSSRGGDALALGIGKPDVTAPGVQILAGSSPQHVDVAVGPQGELFQAIAGTSMSSPHVAGAAALLKAEHRRWTPGQIKSALMTSAQTKVVKEDGVTPADAFDYGSGRIDLTKAGDVGLTFDETGANYVALQDQLWNANYPSLYVPVMPGSITVKRTVHNETDDRSTWTTSVSAPSDVQISVPDRITVPGRGKATFSITVNGPAVPLGAIRFAMITFRNGRQQLHFPVTFIRRQPAVTLTKTCDPLTLAKGAVTNCTVTATNTTFSDTTVTVTDNLPKQLKLNPASVTGATAKGNGFTFTNTLAAAQPPSVAIADVPGSSPATSPTGGYLPLSALGIAPIAGIGDETITNFNVPAFVFGGETYTRIGVVSNGYVVLGGGSGGDINYLNQIFPDATPPNNVLAPFWTDFNPPAGGQVSIGLVTDGVSNWIVVDYNAVKEFSTAKTDSFEIWILEGTVQGINFTYGDLQGNGDGGLMTVGAENRFGNRGANFYANGTGTFPASTSELVVSTTPIQGGGSQVVTYSAKGDQKGDWQNCAQLTSPLFQGINFACVSGTVTR